MDYSIKQKLAEFINKNFYKTDGKKEKERDRYEFDLFYSEFYIFTKHKYSKIELKNILKDMNYHVARDGNEKYHIYDWVKKTTIQDQTKIFQKNPQKHLQIINIDKNKEITLLNPPKQNINTPMDLCETYKDPNFLKKIPENKINCSGQLSEVKNNQTTAPNKNIIRKKPPIRCKEIMKYESKLTPSKKNDHKSLEYGLINIKRFLPSNMVKIIRYELVDMEKKKRMEILRNTIYPTACDLID